MNNIDEREWRRLIRTIQRDNCIVVLGPHSSTETVNQNDVPLRQILSEKLSGLLADTSEIIDKTDLAHVAQEYYRGDEGRTTLEIEVEDFYKKYKDKTTDFHRDLAKIPISLCINATHDQYLYNAMIEAGDKKPVVDLYDFRKPRNTKYNEPGPETPVIYNLLGNPDFSETLVLTETDWLDFLIAVIQGTSPVPPYVASRVADENTSFLFLGFGFEDWSVRILLHALQAHGHKERSLAVERQDFFNHPNHPTTIVFYQNEHLVKFHNLSLASFARQLREQFEKHATAPSAVQPSVAVDNPVVFLCHCSEDRDAVADIEAKLHALNVDTWRDVQNLRGGANWDRQIRKIIEKAADYVLVVQSSQMTGQTESYFYKEIRIARERQSRMADGIRFIIPCQIEDDASLDELSDLHNIPLKTEQDFRALATSIHEDWQGRKGPPVS